MARNRYINDQLPQTESHLFGGGMPRNVREEIIYPLTFTSTKILGIFAQTCQKAEAETAFIRLMIATVEAEPISYHQVDKTSLAAIAILKRHPELLFIKGMITDHFGRKLYASPYQLLLGAGDVLALKQVHEEIMPNIKGGEAKAEVQFQEQFPNCKLPFDAEIGEVALYDDRNIALVEQTKEALKRVVAVITTDPCINGLATLPVTSAAVEKLRQLFAPKEGEMIRTGLHFPLAIIKEMARVNDSQFTLWSWEQQSFFSREVIGTALAASTAVDGQFCKHGLVDLNMKNGPDRRDGLFCRHPKGIPSELTPISKKLGRTMFVDPYSGDACFLSSTPGDFYWYNKSGLTNNCGWCYTFLSYVEEIMLRKSLILEKVMVPRREEKTSRCVIC